jgi:hypothetical protein
MHGPIWVHNRASCYIIYKHQTGVNDCERSVPRTKHNNPQAVRQIVVDLEVQMDIDIFI